MSKGSSGGGAGSATQYGGSTAIRKTDGVSWVKDQGAINSGEVAVKVSVDKLDKAWQTDKDFHLKPGSVKPLDPNGKTLNMPRVNYKGGKVSITDGRHRTAGARDSGKKTIYITVPRGQAARVKRDLGAD